MGTWAEERGRIRTVCDHWVLCAVCDHDHWVDGVQAARRRGGPTVIMREQGWHRQRDRGWVCPSCVRAGLHNPSDEATTE